MEIYVKKCTHLSGTGILEPPGAAYQGGRGGRRVHANNIAKIGWELRPFFLFLMMFLLFVRLNVELLCCPAK